METVDDLTASALAEETGTPVALTPAPVEASAAEPSSVQTDSNQIGTFDEPDYLDILSDRDRTAEVPDDETPDRPLDPVTPVAAAEAVVPEPVAPVTPVVSAPQSVESVAVTPVAAAPVAPTPRVAPSPEEQAAAVTQLQGDIMKELTKLYQFSPEEAAKLDEFEQKPSEYLPLLLAKAHQNAYAHSYQAIMAAMPTMVNDISSVNIQQKQAEDAFFTRWPDLKGQDEVVLRAVKTYRQMNPQTTVKDAIERAGMLAMISIGKNPAEVSQSSPAVPEVPVAPPSRPAMPGGGGGPLRTAPRTYEEGVYDEIYRDEKNFGRG